jgi:D-3-phosphoglycerate dehydrogenase
VIDAASKCKHIARYGIGLDNIDVTHATALGIPVTNVPIFCLEEVTDHALALIYAMTRRVVRFDRAIRAGRYPGEPFLGIPRIAGMKLGLIGYGNIGRLMGKKARALGMTILVSDPAVPKLPSEHGRALPLDQLLAEADVVSVHAPLLPQTRNLISDEAIAKMKPGAYLVNTSRGGLADLDAVLRGLESGRLAGAALDVYPEEPPRLAHPLFQHPLFIATPHAAFYSEASVRDLQMTAAGQVRSVLRGVRPPHIVNPAFAQNGPRVRFESE